jgi:hypothetical protein
VPGGHGLLHRYSDPPVLGDRPFAALQSNGGLVNIFKLLKQPFPHSTVPNSASDGYS